MTYPSFSPCTVHVDLSCIRRNLQRLPAPPAAVIPVIKSNAYGHGLLPVAQTVIDAGVNTMAVGVVEEGVYLRQHGVTQRLITLLGAVGGEQIQLAAQYDITPLIYSFESLENAVQHTRGDKEFPIVIKCDTGMSRLGFTLQQLPSLLDLLRQAPWIRPVLALSHFACADMPEEHAFNLRQARLFDDACTLLHEHFPTMQRTLCNSAGALAYPEYAGDYLRPGQAIYGCNPLYATTWEAKGAALEPAMSVSTPVLQIRELNAGDSISYGRTFTATTPMRVAIIGIGYADGFARHLSQPAQVVIAGQRVSLCGRVCMGMTIADVTQIPQQQLQLPLQAWIAGGPFAAGISIQELADNWGTIPYEVQCLLGNNTHTYA